MKVALTTLGCKVNQFETETMEGLFKQRGYEVVPFDACADVYVINTCSVTSLGDRKSRQIIRRAHRENPQAIVAVCGCYAQVAPDEIRAIEGVRVVLGTKERAHIVDYVEKAMHEDGIQGTITDIMQAKTFEDIPLYDSPERTRAFLKVQDGCDYCCSYCTIHYARGSSRNMPVADLVAEARQIAAGGQKEIVLTGVNTGDFGRTTGEKFIDLLRALDIIAERSQRQLPPPTANFRGIVGKEPYPIGRKTGEVLRQLLLRGVERLKNLFRGSRSRSEVVATFLAILDLCKTNSVTLEDDPGGENPNVRLLDKHPREEMT